MRREVIMSYDEDGTSWSDLHKEGDLVRCKDCVKHNVGFNDECEYVSDICPLVQIRGKAQGHEFDYQYCCYGKRKEDA